MEKLERIVVSKKGTQSTWCGLRSLLHLLIWLFLLHLFNQMSWVEKSLICFAPWVTSWSSRTLWLRTRMRRHQPVEARPKKYIATPERVDSIYLLQALRPLQSLRLERAVEVLIYLFLERKSKQMWYIWVLNCKIPWNFYRSSELTFQEDLYAPFWHGKCLPTTSVTYGGMQTHTISICWGKGYFDFRTNLDETHPPAQLQLEKDPRCAGLDCRNCSQI